MIDRRKTRPLKLPSVVAGDWSGEIVGAPSVNFGQVVAPGFAPPLRRVHLHDPASHANHAELWVHVAGRCHDHGTDVDKKDFPDAGAPFPASRLLSLSLSLEVTRGQFSDMLLRAEARRFKDFQFTLDEGSEGFWPVRSWGMGVQYRDGNAASN